MTEHQRDFLLSCEEPTEGWLYCCTSNEWRTALSLERQGFICILDAEDHHGHQDFEIKLNEKGIQWIQDYNAVLRRHTAGEVTS